MITFRRNRTLLAAFAFTISVASNAPAQSLEDYPTRFDRIWRTTQQRFYDINLSALDWQAVGERYRPQAAAAKSRAEFQRVVNRMLAVLHASHAGYFTDDDMEYYLLKSLFEGDMEQTQMSHIGLMGSERDGVFVVKAILDGGPAAQSGLRPGDRIVDVEGRPFTTVGSFKGREGTVVKLTVDRPGHGRITVPVTPVKQNPQRAFLEATEKSVRVIERNGRRFGYIHLWTMTNDRFKQALDTTLTRRLATTDGLVIDLRDGFGGHPQGFTDVLFRPDIVWSQRARGGSPATSRYGYGKPLVVLINDGTRSAKEAFAYQIKTTARGVLVGTTTAGAFLGAGGFPMGDDGYLELPVVDLALDGKRLEGVGVSADIRVEAADPYGPDDRQLARGLEELEKRVAVAKSTAPSLRTEP